MGAEELRRAYSDRCDWDEALSIALELGGYVGHVTAGKVLQLHRDFEGSRNQFSLALEHYTSTPHPVSSRLCLAMFEAETAVLDEQCEQAEELLKCRAVASWARSFGSGVVHELADYLDSWIYLFTGQYESAFALSKRLASTNKSLVESFRSYYFLGNAAAAFALGDRVEAMRSLRIGLRSIDFDPRVVNQLLKKCNASVLCSAMGATHDAQRLQDELEALEIPEKSRQAAVAISQRLLEAYIRPVSIEL